MNQEELLENEQIEKILSPHPLSFMGLQSLCIFLIIWGIFLGWLVNFSEFINYFQNPWLTLSTWGIVLMVVGVIASILTIRWRIFFFYLFVFIGGIAILLFLGSFDDAGILIPFYSVSISILGFLIVEIYRRSHKYIISNQRIIFKGGVITKQERTLRYDKITDINSKQGIIGQIFGFGTIIPISQSGFGLGSDNTFAAGGAQVGEKKVKFLGIFGGGKELQTPRTRSYYELHGVFPYKNIKKIVENHVQGSVITPYQKEQVTFQKEQVDIQKQMRDLLKKQSELKDNKSEADD
jgi:hypothetical protein